MSTVQTIPTLPRLKWRPGTPRNIELMGFANPPCVDMFSYAGMTHGRRRWVWIEWAKFRLGKPSAIRRKE